LIICSGSDCIRSRYNTHTQKEKQKNENIRKLKITALHGTGVVPRNRQMMQRRAVWSSPRRLDPLHPYLVPELCYELFSLPVHLVLHLIRLRARPRQLMELLVAGVAVVNFLLFSVLGI
jgi:hypothetical protein